MRMLKALIAGRIVVIRPHRFGNSPPRDCEVRVKFAGALEGTGCFVVIEGEDQAQALVEELLGLYIFGRDG